MKRLKITKRKIEQLEFLFNYLITRNLELEEQVRRLTPTDLKNHMAYRC